MKARIEVVRIGQIGIDVMGHVLLTEAGIVRACPRMKARLMSQTSPSRWTKWRDMFAAIRELLVVVAIVLLLVAPSTVRSTLERAGIRSVAGIEFDLEGLAQSEAEMESAEADLQQIMDQIAQLSQEIKQTPGVSSNRVDPQDHNVSKLLEKMELIGSSARKAQNQVQKSRDRVIRIQAKLPRQIALADPKTLFVPTTLHRKSPATPPETARVSAPSDVTSTQSTPIQWTLDPTITQPLERSLPRLGTLRAQRDQSTTR